METISTSFAADASIVSIFGFTSNLLSQAIFNNQVNVTDAFVVAALMPANHAYGALYNGVPRLLKELASGSSFVSVDLLVRFSMDKFNKRGMNMVEKNSKSNYNMGEYNLKTSFGN